MLFYWKKEEWPHVREALIKWNRRDLIGRGSQHLVPPGPSYGAWRKKDRNIEYAGMGMKIQRATRQEELEETWEAVAEVRQTL